MRVSASACGCLMSLKVIRLAWHCPVGGAKKLALIAMADWADDQGGRLYPSIAAIARRMGASNDHARRTVHKLIRLGFIEVVGNENGGPPGTTRRYQINIERLTAGAGARGRGCAESNPTPRAESSPTACTRAGDGLHPRRRRLAPAQANPLITTSSHTSSRKRNGARLLEIDPGFAQFWSAYPRKAAKADAQKAWSKLTPSPGLLSAILSAVRRNAQSADWQKEGGRFIPYPATWLNGHRWEDALEIELAAQPRSVVV